MNDKIYTLDEIKAIASPIARQYGVAAMYLFGSYARGEATPNSDLDFRIDKGRLHSLFQLSGMQIALENGFKKDLDLLTTQMLSPEFLNDIHQEEVLIYAQAGIPMINTEAAVSVSEANQDVESTPCFSMTDDEKIDIVAARILKKYKPAFEKLAK